MSVTFNISFLSYPTEVFPLPRGELPTMLGSVVAIDARGKFTMRGGVKTNRISIGELSRLAGVKVETIRYYERVGLLDEPSRTAGGNRVYGKEDASRLRFIRRCRELGFPVADVRSLLALSDHDEPDCDRTREITWRQLQAVRARIASLARLEQTLEAMTSACRLEQQQERCPIIDSLNAE